MQSARNLQFNKFARKKAVPKQGENSQDAANNESQIVGAIETNTLDITSDSGEKLHAQGQKVEMVTPDGVEITVEKSEIEQIKRTGSVRVTEELDAIIKTPRGSVSHMKKMLTEYKSSDGSIGCTQEVETDHISSQGDKRHITEKHSIIITPDDVKTEIKDKHTDILLSSGETVCLQEQETLTTSGSTEIYSTKNQSMTLFTSPVVQPHVLDLLEVGKRYNINDFTGTVPELHSMALTGYYAEEPVWKHTSCTLSVESGDAANKYLIIEAEVDAQHSNTTYGITGKYQAGVHLQKQGDGVICTQLKGLSGTIGMPYVISVPASLISPDTCNLGAYGAGSTEQPLALPVLLTNNHDGTFNLKIEVDCSKLNLTGLTYLMHELLAKLGFSKPSTLEGKIDITHALTNTNSMKK